MADDHIVLSGVRKSFGPKQVLNGIELAVPKGHSMVVIGGSGTGKSVMLKCILGIIRPDEGSIRVAGEEVTKLTGKARDDYLQRFGMLFQGAALFDSLPVWENVAFGLIQGRRMARAKARDIAMEKLGQVGLGEDVGKLYPAELSGGMQKRVGLARAIAAEPEIIFFDEPTTGLDPQARHLVWQKLRGLRAQGVTMLLTTHYMDEAAHLCDRIVIIDRGKIIEEGTPDGLIEKHAGKEVIEVQLGDHDAAPVIHELLRHDGLNVERFEDILYVFPQREGEFDPKRIEEHVERIIYRRANLEDVFLKLTGRGLAAGE